MVLASGGSLTVTGVLSKSLQNQHIDVITAAILVEDQGTELAAPRSGEIFKVGWTDTKK